jgi:hypothetical protein
MQGKLRISQVLLRFRQDASENRRFSSCSKSW